MAREKKSKGKPTGKGYRPIETAGQGFEKVWVPDQDPNRPYRALPTLSPRLRPPHMGRHGHQRVSRGRRVLEPYGLEDPQEARAVPESVFPGTILERIVYKRNLVLYGPPSALTWTSQQEDFGINNTIGGVRLDFVYFITMPPLALEPQGRYWHGPFARPGDDLRGFLVRGLGYRYVELWEEDVLGKDDAWLDAFIRDAVGNLTGLGYNPILTLPKHIGGIIRPTELLKENIRNI